MAFKVLGQANPPATTATDLYTVPAGKSAVTSTLWVCNQGASCTYRIAVRPAGASLTAAHYLIKDLALPGNSSDPITTGITLAAGDVVTVYASTANVSFGLCGDES